jgi:hypothetical protein
MSLQKLLNELGIDEATSNSITDDTLPQAVETVVNRIKGKLLEDESFYQTIDRNKLPQDWFKEKFGEGQNKIAGIGKSAIDKHFGLTETEKANFTEDEKKDIGKYIEKAAGLYKSKFNVDKDISALQDENITLKQQLDTRTREINSLNEKFESTLAEKLTAKETETLALIEASGLQQNVPVSINLIWDKVYNSIKNKYAVIVENGVSSIRKKDNINFKVDKADKSGHMELKDAIADELKALGAWKEVQAGGQAAGGVKTVTIQPNKSVSESEKRHIEYEKQFHS